MGAKVGPTDGKMVELDVGTTEGDDDDDNDCGKEDGIWEGVVVIMIGVLDGDVEMKEGIEVETVDGMTDGMTDGFTVV